jgi:carbon monoxide dehydrogenase subunit G
MKLHEERWVAKPIDAVFAYTADFSNIEEWDPGVATSSQIGSGGIGLGTRFNLDVKFGGSTAPAVFEITEYEQDERVKLKGTSKSWTAIDEIRFESADAMTRIIYTTEITLTNFLKYLAPLMAPVFNRVGRRALDGLVARLES